MAKLVKFTVWFLLIFGLGMIIVPTVMGFVGGVFAGTIQTIDDGKVWFYRHGLAHLIGLACIVAGAYVNRAFKSE